MSKFSIDLGSLRQGVSRVELEASATDMDLPADAWVDPVRGELEVQRTGERVSVRGTVAGIARLECFRCLGAFEMPIRAALEVFAEKAGTGRASDEKQLERDEYMRFHDGRQIDLADAAREALLLELPMVHRCREDCLGLCPRCGADLNAGPCGCPPE